MFNWTTKALHLFDSYLNVEKKNDNNSSFTYESALSSDTSSLLNNLTAVNQWKIFFFSYMFETRFAIICWIELWNYPIVLDPSLNPF